MLITKKIMAVSAFVMAIGAASPVMAETTGQYIDDATITTKVKAALLADPPLKAMQISVETKHGVVELTGPVDTKAQEVEAVRVANQVNGVKSVKDMLTIKAQD